jgi:hypothetical protein
MFFQEFTQTLQCGPGSPSILRVSFQIIQKP